MPETLFHVRWPDGRREACYSPSFVIKDHLSAGEAYGVADFVARSRTALQIASERVRAIYGFPCSRALSQIARIEAIATSQGAASDGAVHVEAFED